MPEKTKGNNPIPDQLRQSPDHVEEADIDRLEDITGGADEPQAYGGGLDREIDKLDASTDEEVDALQVNLLQDDDSIHNPRYGTGLISDPLAEEHIAGATEVGPDLADKGVVAAVPSREDTSARLRSHHPHTEIARAQDVVEGNLEETREEARTERKVDEGTAA